MQVALDKMVGRLEAQESAIKELEKAARDQGDQIALEKEVAKLVAMQGSLKGKIDDQENRSRHQNLPIVGLPEGIKDQRDLGVLYKELEKSAGITINEKINGMFIFLASLRRSWKSVPAPACRWFPRWKAVSPHQLSCRLIKFKITCQQIPPRVIKSHHSLLWGRLRRELLRPRASTALFLKKRQTVEGGRREPERRRRRRARKAECGASQRESSGRAGCVFPAPHNRQQLETTSGAARALCSMDFTSAVLLNLSVVCINLILVDTMNSTIQDGLREKQQGTNEPDIFSIISKANNELCKKRSE
ncbi:uncharacterized protein [Scyliorhinus torazame]|uniref:uncharacterized protein n=1 Tax=Scyliorhinus torazame TaxID=75743 RepID=UPI003B59B07C